MPPERFAANVPRLYAVRLLFWMHFFGAVLVPFYQEWGGLSLAAVFALNGWFFLCNFLFEVPTGTVADFLGRRRSLALGSAVGVGAALLYVSTRSFPVFMLAEALFAVAYTLHSGADEALAWDSLKAAGRLDGAKAVIARMEAFKLLGIVVATLSGAYIADRFGLPAVMYAYAIPAALAFCVSLTLVEAPTGADRPHPDWRAYRALLREGGRYLRDHAVVRLLAVEAALTNAFAWGLIWTFQPMLLRSGVELRHLGYVHAAACLGQIAFLTAAPRLEGFLGSKRRLLSGATVLSGAAFVALSLAADWRLVAPLVVLAFAFSLPRVALFAAHINAHLPSDKRATVLSFTSMLRTLAIAVVNPLLGLVAQWSLGGVMALIGLLLWASAALSRVEESHLDARG
jgi:MFS family permease